jgi:glycosyltransferase involved in cell wall biosynthesis
VPWGELEWFRYRPTRLLTERLKGFDIVQAVTGSAVWANVCYPADRPVLIQVATTLRSEREVGGYGSKGLKRFYQKINTRLCAQMERRALKKASCIFVENAWMAKHVRSLVEQDKVVFAPPGVDADLFRPNPAETRKHLLYVGRINDPRKNVRLLLMAYANARKVLGEIPPLVLAGLTDLDADDRLYVKEQGLDEHVKVVVGATKQGIAELHRGAVVFLLGSNEEGLGMVVLEAMASGTAVVSTDCGGTATAVVDGETGYLVPVRDSGAFSDRLIQLLRNPDLRARLGRAGRRRIDERFSIAQAIKPFIERYHAAAKGGKNSVLL